MQPMMVHDLHNRAVVTFDGTKLGSLKDVVIDIDSGRVLQYCVKHGLIGGEDLLVSSDAVIEIRPDAIVVKDATVLGVTPAVA